MFIQQQYNTIHLHHHAASSFSDLKTFSLSQGERSFFLQPGESLEQGIQDVYVLSEEEGLVLRAVEAFNDVEEEVRDPKQSS